MSARLVVVITVGVFLSFLHSNALAAISFSITNPHSEGDGIAVDIEVSGLTSSSCQNGTCYLQAVFTNPDTPRYFGFTQNKKGDWFEYSSSPETEYIATMFYPFSPQDGSWSGRLIAKANIADSDYSGPGSYSMKVLRYSGKSMSAAGESNTASVSIVWPTLSPSPTGTPLPTHTPTQTLTPTNVSTNTPTKTPTATGTPTSTKSPTLSDTFDASKSGELDESTSAGVVLGEEQPEMIASGSGKNPSKNSLIPIFALVGAGSGLLGVATLLYKILFRKTI